jgi:hypothetical protein
MNHAIVYEDRSAALAAEPVEFICADCERVERSLDRKLPQGWDRVEAGGHTVVRCPDCNEAIEREDRRARLGCSAVAVDQPLPLVLDSLGWTVIRDEARGRNFAWYLYNGCRIGHWLVPETGSVALQISGGATEGEANAIDDAVLFSLCRTGLREFIEHLEALERQLAPELR